MLSPGAVRRAGSARGAPAPASPAEPPWHRIPPRKIPPATGAGLTASCAPANEERAVGQLDEALARIDEMTAEVAATRDTVVTRDAALQAAAAERAALEATLAGAREELAQARQRGRTLSSMVSDTRAELSADAAGLREALAAARAKASELGAGLAASRTSVYALDTELRQTRRSLESRLARTESSLAETGASLAQARDRNAYLLDVVENEREAWAAERAGMQQALESARAQASSLGAKLADLSAAEQDGARAQAMLAQERERLLAALTAEREQVAALEGELAEAREEADTVRTRLAAVRDESRALGSEVSELETKLENYDPSIDQQLALSRERASMACGVTMRVSVPSAVRIRSPGFKFSAGPLEAPPARLRL